MRPADGKQRHRVVELRQPQLASSVMNAKIPVSGPLSEEQLDQLSGATKRYTFEHRPIQCGERRRESVATSRARVVAEKSSSAAVESAPRRATNLLRRHP